MYNENTWNSNPWLHSGCRLVQKCAFGVINAASQQEHWICGPLKGLLRSLQWPLLRLFRIYAILLIFIRTCTGIMLTGPGPALPPPVRSSLRAGSCNEAPEGKSHQSHYRKQGEQHNQPHWEFVIGITKFDAWNLIPGPDMFWPTALKRRTILWVCTEFLQAPVLPAGLAHRQVLPCATTTSGSLRPTPIDDPLGARWHQRRLLRRRAHVGALPRPRHSCTQRHLGCTYVRDPTSTRQPEQGNVPLLHPRPEIGRAHV